MGLKNKLEQFYRLGDSIDGLSASREQSLAKLNKRLKVYVQQLGGLAVQCLFSLLNNWRTTDNKKLPLEMIYSKRVSNINPYYVVVVFFFHSIYYLIFSSVLQVKFQYRNVFNSRFGTAGGANLREGQKGKMCWFGDGRKHLISLKPGRTCIITWAQSSRL